jgi:molybdopterin-guanine dinucleotide biosynthesis protein A
MTAELNGLVLTGGRSSRMQQDKAALEYGGRSQLERSMALLAPLVNKSYVSVRAAQAADPVRKRFAQIVDGDSTSGPAAGILAAQQQQPTCAWLVLACDLPFLGADTLAHLIQHRDRKRLATAYRSQHDGLPEPLCAIYEPSCAAPFAAFVASGRNCPRKFLLESDTLLLDQPQPHALDNVNTPDELRAAQNALTAQSTAREIRVQYFALLREQARCAHETLVTRADTPRALFAELTARHAFTLGPDMLKVAVNSEFADWARPLNAGDSVVFIPPVAGG